MKTNKKITVCCYNRIEYWNSRAAAKKFYKEGMMYCDGCEKERYTNVFLDLDEGLDICTDGESDYQWCLEEKRFLKVNSPDGTRDYGGKLAKVI